MKVLVIGSGGREHAICWKLRQSKRVTKLFAAPGNPGISKLAEICPLKIDDLAGLRDFALSEKIDLTIVGPEYPLSLGIVDEFKKARLVIFGPTKAAAQLEASKSFCKDVMIAAGVPTAKAETFKVAEPALKYIDQNGAPIVIKADGLAAGKGVVVATTVPEAKEAVRMIFDELKSDKLVIEQFLPGIEVSYIVATDGERVVPCASSHDYKRIFDNDKGPNTGGMGTVSPTPRLTPAQAEWAMTHVIQPVVLEMKKRGTPFCGFLYAGLMISPSGDINVLEFNARMGDPECQSIMRRLKSDLAEILYALASGGQLPKVEWDSRSAVCVVLAGGDYPAKSSSGDEIIGIDHAEVLPECVVFHAGTSSDSKGKLLTSGGRVLNVTAVGQDLEEARSRAYRGCDMIQFRGRQLRRDIGAA